MVRSVQANEWREELNRHLRGQMLKNNSNLLRLKPFIDEHGIIRMGGRLKHAKSIDILQKNPIVLPATKSFRPFNFCK